MKPETTNDRICRFGVYEADFHAGTLKRHGVALRLQEQPFRILGFLLERPGQIVSRDEMRNRLWPEGTFVEFDGSLNTALMKLRAALNDDSENPRFVETVPKKGYRFIAPVEVLPAASDFDESDNAAGTLVPETADRSGPGGQTPAEQAEPTDQTGESQSKPNSRKLIPVAFLLAGVALVAVAAWVYWPLPEPKVTKVTQLTHSGRVAPESRVVTDGARLYFVSREGGQWTLMTTSVHGGSVEKLASPFENTTIFDVSPDRTQLLIGPYGHEGEEIPVWIWPAHGGVPHRLGDVLAKEAEWSPTGNLIVIARGNHLLIVTRDGSKVKELQSFPALPHSLAWSGDGTRIRFTLTNLDHATDEMWEIRADGGGLHRVLQNVTSDLHDTTGLWSTDANYFLFTRGSDSRLNEVTDTVSNVWVSREGAGVFSRHRTAVSEVTHGPVSYHDLAGTGDSDRFFALGTHPEYQLIRVNPAPATHEVILPDAGATDVDVTPDGEWLVYSLRENGALWKSRRNGRERQELTALPPGAIAPQWSPDQKEILFTAYFLAPKPQLYVIPSAGGTPRAVLGEPANGSSASGDWSPDGKQILFEYLEHDVSDLRILDRTAQKIAAIPDSQGLVQARWSPDGKYIAAISPNTKQILLYSLDSKRWSALAQTGNAQGMRWSADSNFVYYQQTGDPEQSVYRVRLGHNQPEKVLQFSALLGSIASQCRFTGVAPDGSIYATLDRGGTDVYALDLKLP